MPEHKKRMINVNTTLNGYALDGAGVKLGTLFECPLIWYTAEDISWESMRLMHEESSPIQSLDAHYDGGNLPFTVKERALQVIYQTYSSLLRGYQMDFIDLPVCQEVYKRALVLRGHTMLAYKEVVRNASLMLVNSHPPLGQGLALPANVVYIGGHHMNLPLKPLPKSFQMFMDKAKSGVIFVDLGPRVNSKNIPRQMMTSLLQMFEDLEVVVLWRLEGRLEYVPKNIQLLERAPRLSILCHNNTVGLVSDGSITSLMDAVYCGIPVVMSPLVGDQFLNAQLADRRGFGIRVDLTDHFAWKLQEAVIEIIRNDSYRRNVQAASRAFKHRLHPARAAMLHHIQAVIEGYTVYLKSHAVHLSPLERYHLDICLSVVLMLWFLSKVLKIVKIYVQDVVDYKKKYS
ncbi:hypothetical protein ACJJTC_002400 [Scirpophaga incertulas]